MHVHRWYRKAPLLLFALGIASGARGGDTPGKAGSESWSSFLPIWAERAEDRGYELPLPFGVGVQAIQIRQNYEIKDLDLAIQGPVPIPFPGVEVGTAKGEGWSVVGRLDAWLFPFLNVYGILGHTQGDSRAPARVPGELLYPVFGIANDLSFPFTLEYEGMTYGGGATLAYGYREFFFSVDYNYTETDLDIADSRITAHVLTPRLGWSGNVGRATGAAWVGAMYQGLAQEFRGTLNIELPYVPQPIPVRYAVDQEPTDPWNLVVGLSWRVRRHVEILVEAGMLKRQQILSALTFRF